MSVILSAAKRSRRIPRRYLKAFASESLGPSRTGVFARDDEKPRRCKVLFMEPRSATLVNL